ncbi:MAG: hypothetical protein HFACDABA_01279 [Anaerolineales bacterium]|nr:hypothetical protein [Anaerolineales bacterium]
MFAGPLRLFWSKTVTARTTTLSFPEKPVFFVSLRTKLIAALALLFVLTFVAIFGWLDKFVTDMAMKNLQGDLLATARAAASGIDGDAHTALVQSGRIDDPTYTAIAEHLRTIKKANPQASGVYTYILSEKNATEVNLIVSAALPPGVIDPSAAPVLATGQCAVPPSSRPELGQIYSDTSPAMLDGVRVAGADTTLWEDEWGAWLSGYAPILNSAGEPVGAVGVDMCARDVIELQNNIQRNVAVALAISLILLTGVVYIIAAGVTRPVLALTKVADRIGVGDYEQDFTSLHTSRIQDEVDKLASVFELMVGKVYTREQSLRARVQQLEIMIDQGKREDQVAQIVESDFFQDLQAKVKDMRTRFKEE